MDRLVRRHTLALLLKVDPKTVSRWTSQGLLPRAEAANKLEAQYWQGAVNRLLASWPRSTEEPLTYEQLFHGKAVLITLQEAVAQIGTSHDSVQTQIDKGRLAGVQVGKQWRVTQASVDAYLDAVQYTTAVAGNIIGIDRQATHLLLEAGELERHPFSSHFRGYVTQASLEAYLKRHLAPWVIPAIWREERMADHRPLLRVGEIARQLNRSARLIQPHLEVERVDYIWSPKLRERHYSPTAFDTYMDMERVLTHEEIGAWFSVHPTVVNRWRGLSLIHCPLPQHTHNEWPRLYRESCWRAIVQELLSPGLKAHLWIANRKYWHGKLLGPHLAAARLGIQPEEVVALALHNELRGIRTPEGEWRFSQDAVKRFRWRQRW